MTLNRVSSATIACGSVSDGARLAAVLASPKSWSGMAPDQVAANGASVELSWFTVTSTTTAVTAAVAAAAPSTGITGGVTVTHRSPGNSGSNNTNSQKI